jgi:hypothetical protein
MHFFPKSQQIISTALGYSLIVTMMMEGIVVTNHEAQSLSNVELFLQSGQK